MDSNEPGDRGIGAFDRFADRASRITSLASFFTLCLALCIVWLPSWFLIRDVETWQLIMVTVTNVATFLMVALVQNSQWRNQRAMNRKLDALLEATACLVEAQGNDTSNVEVTARLEAVVALEDRISPSEA